MIRRTGILRKEPMIIHLGKEVASQPHYSKRSDGGRLKGRFSANAKGRGERFPTSGNNYWTIGADRTLVRFEERRLAEESRCTDDGVLVPADGPRGARYGSHFRPPGQLQLKPLIVRCHLRPIFTI
jgi:hypothetical protein